MVLPLYLAMTPEEMAGTDTLPRRLGVYAPPKSGLPPGTMLILDDRLPFRPDPEEITAAVKAMGCGSVLLDFEREPDRNTIAAARTLSRALHCPLAAPPGYCEDSGCAVFLPPCPLHIPLEEYLRPWRGREVWLDVTLARQTVTVTPAGTEYGPPAPADRQQGGWFDDTLLCRCVTETAEAEVRFTLFDTPQTLKAKLEQAAKLGVTRAVGLYQELQFKL